MRVNTGNMTIYIITIYMRYTTYIYHFNTIKKYSTKLNLQNYNINTFISM